MNADSLGKLQSVLKEGSAYTAAGSFLLYLAGYLSLRFHLTALGVYTDLATLDERYFFAGARFFVYTVSCVPILLLVALPIAAVAKVLSLLFATPLKDRFLPLRAWVGNSSRLLLAGIVLAVLAIQLVMRQCFVFTNLLLGNELPGPAWLRTLILSDNDAAVVLYYSSLLLLTAVASIALWRPKPSLGAWNRVLYLTLAFLVAVMVLLLPVNYGIVVMDYSMPKTNAIGARALGPGEEAWLIWEGKSTQNYLRLTGKSRSLVSCRAEEVKTIEVTRYDSILSVLFAGK